MFHLIQRTKNDEKSRQRRGATGAHTIFIRGHAAWRRTSLSLFFRERIFHIIIKYIILNKCKNRTAIDMIIATFASPPQVYG